MRGEHPGIAPNYTNAFLVSFGVLTFMALGIIWAIWGFLASLLTGYGAERAITVTSRRSDR